MPKVTRVTITRTRRVSKPGQTKSSRTKNKPDLGYAQTEELIGQVASALTRFGGAGTTWSYTEDTDLERRHGEKWRQGFDGLKARLDQLKQAGHRVDADRVRGIFVFHLSPLDRGMLIHLQNMVRGLKGAIHRSISRWQALQNRITSIQKVESSPLPDRPVKEITAHISGVLRGLRAMRSDAGVAWKEIEAKKLILRKKPNPALPAIISELMPVLLRTGMNEGKAAAEVYELIKAWNPEIHPSTPQSIRVRWQTLKRHQPTRR